MKLRRASIYPIHLSFLRFFNYLRIKFLKTYFKKTPNIITHSIVKKLMKIFC